MKLLKNYEARIRLAKNSQNENASTDTGRFNLDTEQLIEITLDKAKDVVRTVAVAVGAIIVLSAAANTIREVTVKKTRSADKD